MVIVSLLVSERLSASIDRDADTDKGIMEERERGIKFSPGSSVRRWAVVSII